MSEGRGTVQIISDERLSGNKGVAHLTHREDGSIQVVVVGHDGLPYDSKVFPHTVIDDSIKGVAMNMLESIRPALE